MSVSRSSYDLLIIGGGLAGAALGRSMAQSGAYVLIIEKETEFRDRIRGEVLLPWGSVEAKELGIYDILLKACAREFPKEFFFLEGKPSPPRDYFTTTPKKTCVLSFFHPEMQEALLAEAAKAGAEVLRGAAMQAVYPGEQPEAEIEVNGEIKRVSARLIVGGRWSGISACNPIEF